MTLRTTTALLALAIFAVAGCETPKTYSGQHIGDATRAQVEMMIASTHTADGTPRNPIHIDGPTAQMIYDNYLENETAFEQRQRVEDSGLIQIDQGQ